MPEVIHNKVQNTLSIDALREMIQQLSTTEDGENLKGAMTELKAALRDNPDACALMLPEDIGACVHHLRRMTGQLISAEAAKKDANKGNRKRTFTPEEEKDILENLFDGDPV